MKKITYLMAVMLSVALIGCDSDGGTNNPGDPGEKPGDKERMEPSDVKKILCDTDVWKLEYQDTPFFFQFTEDGKVVSTPGEPFYQKDEVTSSYTLDSNGDTEVLLTIDGSGALKYLSSGVENTLVISECTAQKVTAKGWTGKSDMNLTPATAKEWADVQAARKAVRMSADEVKEALCDADVWKMTYEGTTFFFQFAEDGTVISTPGEPFLLKAEVTGNYTVANTGLAVVQLTIDGSGALKYLANNVESVLVVSKCTATEITATGKTYGLDMKLTPATAQEWADVQAAREEAQDGVLNIEALKGNLSCGMIRDANDHFLAHYWITGDDSDFITFSYVDDNRVLQHDKLVLTITADADNKNLMTLSFEQVTREGKSFDKLNFDATVEGEETISIDGDDLKVDSNNGAAFTYYTNPENGGFDEYPKFRNHKIQFSDGWPHGDAKEEILQAFRDDGLNEINFDDRTPRNIVLYPATSGGWGAYRCNQEVRDEINEPGRVYFSYNQPDPYDIGGIVTDKATADARLIAQAPLLNAMFHEDGLFMIEDTVTENVPMGDGNNPQLTTRRYILLISPTTDNWIKWERSRN